MNDGIRLVYPGPMMGIDRVRPHHLIGMDWAQNQSTSDRIQAHNSHLTMIKKRYCIYSLKYLLKVNIFANKADTWGTEFLWCDLIGRSIDLPTKSLVSNKPPFHRAEEKQQPTLTQNHGFV